MRGHCKKHELPGEKRGDLWKVGTLNEWDFALGMFVVVCGGRESFGWRDGIQSCHSMCCVVIGC